jgi:flagellar assembly factor FliW
MSLPPAPAAEAVAVLHFRPGLTGLEGYTRYALTAIDDSAIYWLQSLDEPGLALPVAEAFALFPEYDLELSATDSRALGLTDAAEALVLVVLTVDSERDQITANLLAPIVINQQTGAARQVILDDRRYRLREPVR